MATITTLAVGLMPDMNLSTWAGLVAAATVIGTCWRTISAWLLRAVDLVVCRVALKGDAARAVMSYSWQNGRRSPFGLRLFGGTTSFVFPKRRVEVIGFEGVTSEPLLFLFGKVPMLVAMGQSGNGDQVNLGAMNGSDGMPVTIRFLRGTMNVDTFVETAIQSFNDLRQNRVTLSEGNGLKRFNVVRMHGPAGKGDNDGSLANDRKRRPGVINDNPENLIVQIAQKEIRVLTWKPEELIERSNDVAPFVNHPVAPEILSQFDGISTWLKHETWYRSKGIPWRRGYLITGRPGGGKDTLVRNLAMRYDLPVYAFDLSSYDNRGFTDDWKTVMQNAPAIALISDIDAVMVGRENVAVKGKNRDGLTFDCLLNTISGVGSSEGVLLFITTNRPETLDAALGIPQGGHGKSTRPGRIDVAVEIGPMGVNERRALATIMLEPWPEEIEPVVAAGDGEMAAQFQERCAQLALRLIEERGLPPSIVVEPPMPEVKAPERARGWMVGKPFSVYSANVVAVSN